MGQTVKTAWIAVVCFLLGYSWGQKYTIGKIPIQY